MKTKMKKAAKPMMRKSGKVLPKHQKKGQTGTPFQQLLKNNPSLTPSDTLAAGMPGSTYHPDINDFAGWNALIGAANKATYGREDTSDITTPAEEKKAREGNYRLQKTGGSMYKKGGSVTGKPMMKKSASMKSKTSKKK